MTSGYVASLYRAYGLMKSWSSVALAFEEPEKSLIHSLKNLLGFLYHIFPPLEVKVSTTSMSDA